MSRHIEIGREGEDLAADWLVRHGFSILHRNWRHGRYEVDIIAGHSNILHFIEVKTRRTSTYGHPEESVSRKKIEHMLQGASAWLYRWPVYRRIQYDVLAITLAPGQTPEIVLFEDVYL
ncbi:MAG TPA: YraN family protein [Puia sp.]|nr:YraN family protein [Puia sp.]